MEPVPALSGAQEEKGHLNGGQQVSVWQFLQPHNHHLCSFEDIRTLTFIIDFNAFPHAHFEQAN
jgi:hypothetical protein